MSRLFRCLSLIVVMTTFAFNVNAQTVYKTPSGKKYHLASCRMVTNVSEKLIVAEAVAMRLEPCKICNPGVTNTDTNSDKAKAQSQTVQCKGMTKSGTRCKHMTSIANGYCYQHQPG
jgi:hypothetical protein